MYNQLKLDNQLCFRLYTASKLITRAYKPILSELGITYPQYITLMVLWEKESIDFKTLSKILIMSTGTLTPIVDKLSQKGYVIREKHPEDDRKINISITDEGLALREKSVKIPSDLACALSISEEDYHVCVKDLDMLISKMKENLNL